jgi:hypothetical protein
VIALLAALAAAGAAVASAYLAIALAWDDRLDAEHAATGTVGSLLDATAHEPAGGQAEADLACDLTALASAAAWSGGVA